MICMLTSTSVILLRIWSNTISTFVSVHVSLHVYEHTLCQPLHSCVVYRPKRLRPFKIKLRRSHNCRTNIYSNKSKNIFIILIWHQNYYKTKVTILVFKMMINKVYDDTWFISESLCLCTYGIELYNQFIFEFRGGGGVGRYLFKHIWHFWLIV